MALGEYAVASHTFSMAIGNGAEDGNGVPQGVQTYGANNISIGTEFANYTLSGLGRKRPTDTPYQS